MTREQEEKELEIMKLRIDQQQQDKVEQFRKEMQNKYAKERRHWEEEKQKKLYEIQDSIDDLNLAASDKTKLKGEIDDQIKEQNTL
jgi:predicted phage gp36 major capsid-like protein